MDAAANLDTHISVPTICLGMTALYTGEFTTSAALAEVEYGSRGLKLTVYRK